MTKPQFILALDQGTSSCRSVIFDNTGKVRFQAQLTLPSHFPKEGWVEQDAEQIWKLQKRSMLQVLEDSLLSPSEMAAIGITNQRETLVVWNSETGKAVYPAIVWQDARGAKRCQVLKQQGHEEKIKAITGLPLDSYFSATKLEWILDQVDPERADSKAGKLKAGTIDSWLIYRLTEGASHRTDCSNASRTLLFDIHSLEWSQELLDLFRIPKGMLPEVCNSDDHYGDFKWEGSSIPIRAVLGDQQAALFGQGCLEKGKVKNTYGTGCFMLINTGETAVVSQQQLLTTVAWRLKGEPTTYALEGSVFHAGSAIKWLRDGLGIIESSDQTETYARAIAEEESSLVVVPAFSGLGAPYWDSESRGAIFGITQNTGPNQLAKATLESLAFQTEDLLQAMQADCGTVFSKLAVDGGATANAYLMQFQSNLSQIQVAVNPEKEATVRGAALLAGLAVGLWSQQWIADGLSNKEVFRPVKNAEWSHAKKSLWKKAIKRTLGWLKDEK